MNLSESLKMLSKYGIKAPGKRVSLSEALRLPRPAVLKADTLEHKTEKGLVFTGLDSEEAVRDAYERLSGNDVIGQPQMDGFEFIAGALEDETFGKVVMFGLGGIYSELFRDVAFRAVPLSKEDANDMIRETKVSRIFSGFRGQNPNRDEVVKTLLALSHFSEEVDFQEADINPLIVNEHGAFAVDARVIL